MTMTTLCWVEQYVQLMGIYASSFVCRFASAIDDFWCRFVRSCSHEWSVVTAHLFTVTVNVVVLLLELKFRNICSSL